MIIPLTKDQITIVDDIDSDLGLLKWHVACYGSEKNRLMYAFRSKRIPLKGPRKYPIHRIILSRKIGRPMLEEEAVDHINHDGLDNRRSNLRLATNQENCWNRRNGRNNKSSKYIGVTWRKDRSRWRALIRFNGKLIELGKFKSEIDAAIAYDNAVKRLFSSFGVLNFPDR
jgi:hypothetical protein